MLGAKKTAYASHSSKMLVRTQNWFALVRILETLVKGLSSLPITKNLKNSDTFLEKAFLLSMEKMYRELDNKYVHEAIT